MLYVSWFKWANVQIDFGRELYTAWRLTEGDLLVRDIYRTFGPLSDYWNALMFSLFGVSIKTLFFVNLAIYAAIVTLTMLLLKKAFGFFPAIMASIMGVLIFGFSDFDYWGCMNYIAPYSHGVTHGMLLLLLLMAWIVYCPQDEKYSGIPEGVLFGLLCLTKIEFVFSGGIIIAISSLRNITINGRSGVFFLIKTIVTAALLLLGTWGIFCIDLTPGEAMEAAWACFLIFQTSAISTPFQREMLGVDNIGGNLLRHLLAVGVAACMLGGPAILLRFLNKKHYVFAVPLVFIAVVSVCVNLEWRNIGYVLIGILLISGIYTIYKIRAENCSRQTGIRAAVISVFATRSSLWARLVLIAGALAMLARMPLHTRIYHYGFYQAMLAGVVCFAFAIGVIPRLAGKCHKARVLLFCVVTVALGIGSLQLVSLNKFQYKKRNVLLDESLGSLIVDDYRFSPAPTLMGAAAKYLEPVVKKDDRLMVLPEGVMLNYWLRLKGGTPMVSYTPEIYIPQKETIWNYLLKTPPKYVVGVTRMSIREYGIPYYGYDNDSGKELINWIYKNYDVMHQLGGYPFGGRRFGLIIYIHKNAKLEETKNL